MKSQALESGFQSAGAVAAGPARTWESYSRWVEEGNHGHLAYLAEQRDLKRNLDALLSGAESVLAVALNYNQMVDRTPGRPWIARYALGRDYHKVIRSRLRRIGRLAEERSPGLRWRVAVDSAPLLEREWAQRAGLGWPGKNTCLIDSRRGSFFVLGFLILSHPLVPDQPSGGGCGTCRLCIDACPTGAIHPFGETWKVDARLCLSTWNIEHKGEIPAEIADTMGNWTFGCDVCQEVCPFNHPRPSQPDRAVVTDDPEVAADRTWPDLHHLAGISEEDWDRLTRGSAVRRVGWKGLQRNALINLQNQRGRGGGESPKPPGTG
ncbi:MAG: tRNA epoxyqueuosine(34) reductase QueG [Fimbriimonadaceae bacterium]|nr:tRNA epoxyqueuosine(34) reductase QueG [Fimbriimonadaceae bacterium]